MLFEEKSLEITLFQLQNKTTIKMDSYSMLRFLMLWQIDPSDKLVMIICSSEISGI